MTYVARLSLSESDALRLSEAIGEMEALGNSAIDAAEIKKGVWEVAVYFSAKPREIVRARLAQIVKELFGQKPGPFIVDKLPDIDWVAKSLEGLKPVRTGRFLVHGAHDRARRRENLINIEIDAGLAFGTGHHGTTAGCLMAIEALGKAGRPRNALDLGAGTGVLAIAVAKAWHTNVLAGDIDPVATKVASENAKRNGVAGRIETITAKGFRHRAFAGRSPFDLILANILAGPLASMAHEFAMHLAPGGAAVLSGILLGQDRLVMAAYRNAGLFLHRRRVREGWVTLVLKRRARPRLIAADRGNRQGHVPGF